MEIIGGERPVFGTLDALRGNYNAAINRSKEIVIRENLATAEGKFVLTFLLATASLLKSAGPKLTQVMSAEPENSEKEIDLVGGEIADILLPAFIWGNWGKKDRIGSEIYIEERKTWEAHPKGVKPLSGRDARMILVDPCDETMSPSYRSVGISIFDKEGEFLSGGVAGLEDEVAVYIEGGRVGFVGLDGEKTIEKDPLSLKFASGAPKHLKIATLNRRLDEQKLWDNLDKISPSGLSLFQTFGGHSLIQMLKGEVDVMIDTFKGQPWYEAAQWGALAENLGFSVEYGGGKIPNARYIISTDTPSRIPLVISRNKEIHAVVLNSLK